MYLFKIKADAADIDVPVARALYGTAVIFCLLNRPEHFMAIAFTAVVLMLLLFTKTLLVRYKINPINISAIASVAVFLATYSYIFPAIIMLITIGVRKAYKQPAVEITKDEVTIIKSFSTKKYEWQSFSNLVLKDKLLTLDFRNNNVLQLEVEDVIDEKDFNNFCIQNLLRYQQNTTVG